MTQEEIDALAASMLRQQAEERQKAEMLARVAAESAAQAAAEEAERTRPAREAAAREAAEKEARISAVLGAAWGARFVDSAGTEHRKAAPAARMTFETVGSTKEGQTVIGRWGRDCDNSPLADWREKD